MMATTEMSSNSHSPRSPNPPRRTTAGLSSPWAQVVVRGVSEPPVVVDSVSPVHEPATSHEPASSSLSTGDGSDKPTGGNVGPKPAWNKPSNGVSVSVAVGGGGGEESLSDQTSGSGSGAAGTATVMGASAWPALSESTRHSLKSSSIDSSSPKPASEGTVPVSQGPLTIDIQEQSKQSSASANIARHRPVKRGGGGNRQGGFSRGAPTPPMPPVFPVPEMAQSGFCNMVPGGDLSSREARPMGAFASDPQSPSDHSSHRASNRRGGFGHGRNNYRGARRDQDHGNHDWVSSQRPHIRDAHPHMPPPSGFMRPHVQGAPPFAFPPIFRPFGNAMVYPDVPHMLYYPLPPDSFRGMPYFPGPPPSSYVVMSDPALHISIVKQIDYYFSDANLVKDEYLRSNMDKDGWVPISLISSFPKVQSLTDNIPYILQCLKRYSSVVEVQSDKIRRRDGWAKWITHYRSFNESNIESPVGSSFDKLTTNLQKVSFDEVSQNQIVKESTSESQVLT